MRMGGSIQGKVAKRASSEVGVGAGAGSGLVVWVMLGRRGGEIDCLGLWFRGLGG